MAKIQETVTVSVDEQQYNVADLSDNVKQMIGMMDEWRQKDADLTSEVLMARAAIRDIQNTILAALKEELGIGQTEVPAEVPAAE